MLNVKAGTIVAIKMITMTVICEKAAPMKKPPKLFHRPEIHFPHVVSVRPNTKATDIKLPLGTSR